MPYLSIQTNSNISEEQRNDLMAAASKIIAAQLNKPESYVMASFIPVPQMILGRDDAITAFLELRSTVFLTRNETRSAPS
jgi:phenylpyruvate tautomerase